MTNKLTDSEKPTLRYPSIYDILNRMVNALLKSNSFDKSNLIMKMVENNDYRRMLAMHIDSIASDSLKPHVEKFVNDLLTYNIPIVSYPPHRLSGKFHIDSIEETADPQHRYLRGSYILDKVTEAIFISKFTRAITFLKNNKNEMNKIISKAGSLLEFPVNRQDIKSAFLLSGLLTQISPLADTQYIAFANLLTQRDNSVYCLSSMPLTILSKTIGREIKVSNRIRFLPAHYIEWAYSPNMTINNSYEAIIHFCLKNNIGFIDNGTELRLVPLNEMIDFWKNWWNQNEKEYKTSEDNPK